MRVERLITEHMDLWTGAITQKSASGRGKSSKRELTGIKKLRELILELAVRGKLVPQDNADESAESFLLKLGVNNESDCASPSSEPFPLPAGWAFRSFIDVLDFQGGGQPPKSQFVDSPRPGYVQLIQIRDLGPRPQPVFVPADSVTKFCTAEDIMVGRYGASVGKVFWGKDGAYNVALIRLDNSVGAYAPKFLYTLMVSPLGQSLFGGISRSAQDGFKKSDIAHRLLPVPPLAEQHRIVQKVDELMALCDQLEQQTGDQIEAHERLVDTLLETLTRAANATEVAENWARVQQHFDTLFTTEHSIDRLKQTILQLAVMGRLVPQFAEDGNAADLLSKVDDEKREAGLKAQKTVNSEPGDGLEPPYEIPGSWEWCHLGAIALKSEAGWSPKCDDSPRTGSEWGVLKVSAVTWGRYKPEENKALPPNLEARIGLEVQGNDFLISRANTAELVARSVVVPMESPKRLMMSDKIIRFVFSNHVEAEYINLVNNAGPARDYYARVAGGTSSSMKNVSRKQIQELLVPLPPAREQTRIVEAVSGYWEICDRLKEQISKTSRTQASLAECLVSQAVH